MNYLIYRHSDGYIEKIVTGHAETLLLNVPDGYGALPAPSAAHDGLLWVEHETGTIHAKGDYPLEALPLPCTITIEGVDYHCTEQPVFEFDAPGSYTIEVDAGPRYLKKEFTIENPA